MKLSMKETKITFETREVIIVRNYPQEAVSFCASCDAQTLFAAPEYFVALTGKSMREIFRAIEDGAFHFQETNGGLLVICFPSFLQLFPQTTLEIPLLEKGNKNEPV